MCQIKKRNKEHLYFILEKKKCSDEHVPYKMGVRNKTLTFGSANSELASIISWKINKRIWMKINSYHKHTDQSKGKVASRNYQDIWRKKINRETSGKFLVLLTSYKQRIKERNHKDKYGSEFKTQELLVSSSSHFQIYLGIFATSGPGKAKRSCMNKLLIKSAYLHSFNHLRFNIDMVHINNMINQIC